MPGFFRGILPVAYRRICNGFRAFLLTVFSMAWGKRILPSSRSPFPIPPATQAIDSVVFTPFGGISVSTSQIRFKL